MQISKINRARLSIGGILSVLFGGSAAALGIMLDNRVATRAGSTLAVLGAASVTVSAIAGRTAAASLPESSSPA